MRSVIAFVVICHCVLFSSGCQPLLHGVTHPNSGITAPMFCLYHGHWTEQEAKPLAIYRLRVIRDSDDRRFEWRNWLSWGKYGYIDFLTADINKLYGAQVSWDIEYAPDGKSKLPEKPFACLIYGKVPPGYVEHIPAQPLIPERVYVVRLQPPSRMPMSWVYFIIRADAQGRPTQLEHTSDPNDPDRIRVIMRE